MRKKLFLYFFILIGFSCNQNQKTTKYDEVYIILDELLRFKYNDVDLVAPKLKVNKEYVSKMSKISNGVDSFQEPPPPPSMEYTLNNKQLFTELYHLNLIDSVDVDYMYNQLNSNETYTLDSTKIKRKVLPKIDFKKQKEKYGTDDFYKIIEYEYNASNYIVLSVPIISKDQKKILLEIEYNCGDTCFSCTQYLFEKIDGKWKIKYSIIKWIS